MKNEMIKIIYLMTELGKGSCLRIGVMIQNEINRSCSLELKTGSLILYDRPALVKGEAETSPAQRHASAVLINLSFQAGV